MKIDDPLIELLAIKLYEHDDNSYPARPHERVSWKRLTAEQRDRYREMARGNRELYGD